MVNFPGSLDDTTSLPDPGTGNFTDNPSHATLHDLENAAIRAIEAKVGVSASTPVANRVFRGTGTGSSAWAQLALATDVTGTLPVANGGTGITALGTGIATFLGTPTSANLLAAVTNETGTGLLVFATSPTLTTPVIGDFTTAQHAHTNAAAGGTLPAAAVPALDYSQQALSNPYKFRCHLAANQSGVADATFTKVAFDTKDYDTNTNLDVTVNKGRYTVPVSGFYQINAFVALLASAGSVGATGIISLYKNASEIVRDDFGTPSSSNTAALLSGSLSDCVQLTAADFIELYVYMDVTSGNSSVVGDLIHSRFSGFLVSRT